MARITDTERGARMALDAALIALHPDLFPDLMPDAEEWRGIFVAARQQLAECDAYRAAVRGGA